MTSPYIQAVLSKAELAAFQKQFDTVDQDGDGTIDTEEFLGLVQKGVSSEDARLVFDFFDTGKQKALNFSQATRAFGKLQEIVNGGEECMKDFRKQVLEYRLRSRSTLEEAVHQGYIRDPSKVAPRIQSAMRAVEYFLAQNEIGFSLDRRPTLPEVEDRRILRRASEPSSFEMHRTAVGVALLRRPSVQHMVESNLIMDPTAASPRIQSALKVLEAFKAKRRVDSVLRSRRSYADLRDLGIVRTEPGVSARISRAASILKFEQTKTDLSKAMQGRMSIDDAAKVGVFVDRTNDWKNSAIIQKIIAPSERQHDVVHSLVQEGQSQMSTLRSSVSKLNDAVADYLNRKNPKPKPKPKKNKTPKKGVDDKLILHFLPASIHQKMPERDERSPTSKNGKKTTPIASRTANRTPKATTPKSTPAASSPAPQTADGFTTPAPNRRSSRTSPLAEDTMVTPNESSRRESVLAPTASSAKRTSMVHERDLHPEHFDLTLRRESAVPNTPTGALGQETPASAKRQSIDYNNKRKSIEGSAAAVYHQAKPEEEGTPAYMKRLNKTPLEKVNARKHQPAVNPRHTKTPSRAAAPSPFDGLEPALFYTILEHLDYKSLANGACVDGKFRFACLNTALNKVREELAAGEDKFEGVDTKLSDAAHFAMTMLDRLSLHEIMNSGINPPAGVKLVVESMCIMLGVKPHKVTMKGSGKVIYDYWAPAQKLISEKKKFANLILNYDVSAINPNILSALEPYIKSPRFSVENMNNCSRAAGQICQWIHGVYAWGTLPEESRNATTNRLKVEKLRRMERRLARNLELIAINQHRASAGLPAIVDR